MFCVEVYENAFPKYFKVVTFTNGSSAWLHPEVHACEKLQT